MGRRGQGQPRDLVQRGGHGHGVRTEWSGVTRTSRVSLGTPEEWVQFATGKSIVQARYPKGEHIGAVRAVDRNATRELSACQRTVAPGGGM
jgi:hypothetical protein